MQDIMSDAEFKQFSEEMQELLEEHGVTKEDIDSATAALASAMQGTFEDTVKFGLDNKGDASLMAVLSMMAFGASMFLMDLKAQMTMSGGGCGGCGGSCGCGGNGNTVH